MSVVKPTQSSLLETTSNRERPSISNLFFLGIWSMKGAQPFWKGNTREESQFQCFKVLFMTCLCWSMPKCASDSSTVVYGDRDKGRFGSNCLHVVHTQTTRNALPLMRSVVSAGVRQFPLIYENKRLSNLMNIA